MGGLGATTAPFHHTEGLDPKDTPVRLIAEVDTESQLYRVTVEFPYIYEICSACVPKTADYSIER